MKKNKFIIDTVWTFGGSLIVGFSGLILQTLINGNLSSESLGVYSQVISFYTLFTALCCMGLETSTVKFISENSDDIKVCGRILSASLSVVIVSSLIVLSIICAIYYFNVSFFSSYLVENTFKYIMWTVPLFAINKLFIATCNAKRQMKQYAAYRSIRWILIGTFTVVFISLGKDLEYCVLSYFYSELILSLYFILFKYRNWISFYNLKPWIYKHITYGVFGLFMAVIGEVNTNVMVIISGYFLSLREIALIGFIMSFTRAIAIAATAVQLNFNPIFIKNSKLKIKDEIEKKMRRIYKITILSSIPLFVSAIIAYHIYVTFFMGENFINSSSLFAIVALGAILTYTSQWNSSMLLLSGKFKGEIIRVSSVLILKVFITFILTKHIGVIGNLSAYTIVEVYSILINVLLVKHILNYNLLKLSYSWK